MPSLSSSHFSNHPSVDPLPCHQVLKRGIVSAYPIHAFALDPPKLTEAFRPNRLSSTSALFDVQDIRSRDSTLVSKSSIAPLPPIFFSKPRPICLITIHATSSRIKIQPTQITVFFPNPCSPLESRQGLACATSGRRC